MTSLHDRIRQLFEDSLNIELHSVETDLIQEGVLDSLLLVELLIGLEDTFGINVDIVDLDIEDFRTVGRIGRLVARLDPREAVDDR